MFEPNDDVDLLQVIISLSLEFLATLANRFFFYLSLWGFTKERFISLQIIEVVEVST